MTTIYDATHSHIERSAIIKSPDKLEHPVSIGHRVEVHVDVDVGSFSFINTDTIVYRNTSIGRYCSFARGCEIAVANHPTEMLSSHSFQYSGWMFPKLEEYNFKRQSKFLALPKTTIGSDVWVGAQSIIKGGVTIGNGAIIAANSVVTEDVPDYAIVGGSPAKLIRYRFDHLTVLFLLQTAWWDLPFSVIKTLPFDDIQACVVRLREIRKSMPEADEAG
ncbi:transferase [Sinorhizobium meliloti]|uniref:CatB-related O-acetyltransferase n=1 Tax=Rhizobium meliloti TaxID=382 RepID=UPI000B49ACD8|nr:CatB-related O-acetyltransferase [Sinorhizobium meliloti]ASP84996.1 transferase [Sinorhizobium meliloti]MQW28503.1 antibiotic acetyltransferase [Sinorhizobium meliloti]